MNFSSFIKFLILLILFSGALIYGQLHMIKEYSQRVNLHLKPFEKINDSAGFKVLFAGDSTCVGTGLDDNRQSTSGYFSQDYPYASIENHCQNGLKLEGLIAILQRLQEKHFDLAVLQIGANDILYFTPMDQIRKRQQQVLTLTKNIARRIIILHSGDIGSDRLFIPPFNWIYTWRTLKVRDIYLISQDSRVSYVDVYSRDHGKNIDPFYARDRLHLNAVGYFIWYSYIKDQMKRQHWLPHS